MLTSSDIASMIDHSMLQPYLTDYEISSVKPAGHSDTPFIT